MRWRGILGAGSVIAVLLCPTAAVAGNSPGVTNLAPANGTIFERVPFSGQGVEVNFTCPRYVTSYNYQIGYYSYSVEFATSPETGPDGTLATAFTVDFVSAYPTNAAETQCRATLHTVHTSPGTYYWQVQNIDVDYPNSHYLGPTSSFVIRAPTSPAPPGDGGGGSGGPNLSLSLTYAKRYAKAVIRDGIGRNPARLKTTCTRLSGQRMRCRSTWRKGKYRYVGRGTFFTYVENNKRAWDFTSFKGTRTGCKAQGGRGSCKRRFSY